MYETLKRVRAGEKVVLPVVSFELIEWLNHQLPTGERVYAQSDVDGWEIVRVGG